MTKKQVAQTICDNCQIIIAAHDAHGAMTGVRPAPSAPYNITTSMWKSYDFCSKECAIEWLKR